MNYFVTKLELDMFIQIEHLVLIECLEAYGDEGWGEGFRGWWRVTISEYTHCIKEDNKSMWRGGGLII